MREEEFLEKSEREIAPQIFSVSAGLVGVCLTVIGLINVNVALKKEATFADELTAVNALIFIIACYFSYSSMKTRDKQKKLKLERAADRIFLTGLSLMVLGCFFVVFRL